MPDATYDSTVGLYPDDSKPKDYKPKQWDGNPNLPQGHGTFANHDPLAKPSIPGPSGGDAKGVSVHTPSMDLFASNVESLIPQVQRVQALVKSSTPVEPGAFYHANVMREKVDGQGGLRSSYGDGVLEDLENGLSHLCTGIRELSKKYQTTEEANKMTATDLNNDMNISSASTEFNGLSQKASVS